MVVVKGGARLATELSSGFISSAMCVTEREKEKLEALCGLVCPRPQRKLEALGGPAKGRRSTAFDQAGSTPAF